MPKVLRCYAEGRPGDWEAFCLDLDLAVQGDSFQEVFASLNEAIEQYIEAVCELPEDQRMPLLNRRAPWRVRAATELKLVLATLRAAFRRRNDDDGFGRYSFPAHA